jgi:ribose transport system substrate-binding protein
MSDQETQSPEVVESILRACELLRAWRYEGELLRLRDVTARTNLRKTTAHRLLQSLVAGGLVERVGREQYRSNIRPLAATRSRIGFAAQTQDSTFSRLVSESVVRAAAERNVDLVCVNNRYSSKAAVRNAESLVRDRVDLVIEFQTYEDVASLVAHRFLEAGIPVIAVEIPHPGAVYFGANNYQAGLIGGRALGRWAGENWRGQVDEILQFEERIAGPLPNSRVTGMLNGILEALPAAENARVFSFDGRGNFEASLNAVRRHLRTSAARRVLVVANNDPSALGALRGFEECGREQCCAVMGQNAIPEAREELRRQHTRLIGSVAYFPERYGDDLVPLALSMLAGKPTPPAIFVKHALVTAANVDRLYPLDRVAQRMS